MKTVVLYTREGCCLCDDARKILLRAHARRPSAFMLEERDIESDDALLRTYLERIPVVAIDGIVSFELVVNEAELDRRLGIVQSG